MAKKVTLEYTPPGRPVFQKSDQKKKYIIWLASEEAHLQLKTLAAEERTTILALMNEALNDLFQKHGKPRIA